MFQRSIINDIDVNLILSALVSNRAFFWVLPAMP